MNLRSLDLNLLVVFDAIYQERSVTHAAEKVFLSQPATSNALARLRTQFRDELFVRTSDGLCPTPRAMELAPHLHTLLSELKLVIEPQGFDPVTTRLRMSIAAIDYFSVVVMPYLMGILAREAPGLRIRILPSVDRPFEDLDHGEIDFVVIAFLDDFPERFGHARLLEDSYSCLLRKDHPLANAQPSVQQYAKASHLLVSPRGGSRSFIDDELANAGLRRNVSLVISHFGAAPLIVAQTDLVLTAPTLLLKRLKTAAHVMHACPVNAAIGYRCLDLVWHEGHSRHPAREWMRGAISRAAAEVASAQTNLIPGASSNVTSRICESTTS